MGGLSVCTPFTSCLMVSNFALHGMPLLSGFYSRDLILEMISMRYVTSTPDLKLVKCHIWIIVLYGAGTWIFRKIDQKYIESSKI